MQLDFKCVVAKYVLETTFTRMSSVIAFGQMVEDHTDYTWSLVQEIAGYRQTKMLLHKPISEPMFTTPHDTTWHR